MSELTVEEKRREAKRAYMREYNKKYREAHKEELQQYAKGYYQQHKDSIKQRSTDYYHNNHDHCLARIRKSNAARRGTNLTYESFSDSEERPTYESAATYLQEGVDGVDDAYNEFTELLKSKGMNDDDIEKAYQLARRSMIYRSSGRGYRFEPLVRNMLLTELDGTDIHVYKQVSINNGACRIDFVVSKEVVDDKTNLKLSDAIIISTKTSCGTSWREDMHLYNKCKAYVMLSLDDDFPTEALPDNVYFASPKLTTDNGQHLTLTRMIGLLKEKLDSA